MISSAITILLGLVVYSALIPLFVLAVSLEAQLPFVSLASSILFQHRACMPSSSRRSITMHFLQLPTELHLQIASYLPQTARAALCLVNRRLRDAYTKPLYTADSLTALSWASRRSLHDTLDLALQHGANVNDSIDMYGRNAFLTGILYGGCVHNMRTLLDHGADPTSRDSGQCTAFHLAAMRGRVDVIRGLLRYGVDISAQNGYGLTALNVAAGEGHLEFIKLILEHGAVADLDVADIDGTTPLRAACLDGHLEVVNLLAEFGADTTRPSQDGSNPFYTAAYNGHLHILEWFMGRKPKPDLEHKTENGWTPLNAAASRGYLEVVQYLIEQGADIETTNNEGWSPLLCAVSNEHPAVVKFLIEEGANLSTSNNHGWLPLLQASKRGNLKIAKMLLEKGADAAGRCNCGCGWTPIQTACATGPVELVKLLLEYGADLRAYSEDGQSPMEAALSNYHQDIVEHLKEKGCVTTPTPATM